LDEEKVNIRRFSSGNWFFSCTISSLFAAETGKKAQQSCAAVNMV
jgi:hypothetical protein